MTIQQAIWTLIDCRRLLINGLVLVQAEEITEAFDMAIEALSADAVQGWIPVSEKPKDEKKTYLVQLNSGGMRSCRWTNANPFWTELTTDWHWNIFDIPQHCKVVAWMDLESYREDGEE